MLDNRPFKISAALGPEHYDNVARKMANIDPHHYRWCFGGECGCMGCLTRKISWAEYECWRKYNPEFNKVRKAHEGKEAGSGFQRKV